MQFSLRLCEYITFWSRLVRKLSSEYPVSVTHLLHGAISGWAVRGSDGSPAATLVGRFGVRPDELDVLCVSFSFLEFALNMSFWTAGWVYQPRSDPQCCRPSQARSSEEGCDA